MKISRKWEMPNSRTFKIKCIQSLILSYIKDSYKVLDPYANEASIKNYLYCEYINNDLDPQYNTNYHLEAQEFLKLFDTNSIDLVLNDPPYSPRQLSECYKSFNRSVTYKDTAFDWYTDYKKELQRIVKPRWLCNFMWLELKWYRNEI